MNKKQIEVLIREELFYEQKSKVVVQKLGLGRNGMMSMEFRGSGRI